MRPPNPDLLRQAAVLVQQFRWNLSIEAPKCNTCDRPHAVNLRDYRTDQELEAVHTKLMRFVGAYEKGTP